MRWLANLLLGLVLFTQPNGGSLHIDSGSVEAVMAARVETGHAPEARAIMVIGGNSYAVREDVDEVLRRLKADKDDSE